MKRTVKVPDQCQMEKKKGQGEIGVSDGEGVDLVQHESTLGEITEEVASQGFDLDLLRGHLGKPHEHAPPSTVANAQQQPCNVTKSIQCAPL